MPFLDGSLVWFGMVLDFGLVCLVDLLSLVLGTSVGLDCAIVYWILVSLVCLARGRDLADDLCPNPN
jgi:hypothetical protein